jgi:hypothetical protein
MGLTVHVGVTVITTEGIDLSVNRAFTRSIVPSLHPRRCTDLPTSKSQGVTLHHVLMLAVVCAIFEKSIKKSINQKSWRHLGCAILAAA